MGGDGGGGVCRIRGKDSCASSVSHQRPSFLTRVPSLLTLHVFDTIYSPGTACVRCLEASLGPAGSSESTTDKRKSLFSLCWMFAARGAIINPTDFLICFRQSHYKVTTSSLSLKVMQWLMYHPILYRN